MRSKVANPGSGHRPTRVGRVVGGATSALVIGGALFAGGLATMVTASAHHLGTPATTPKTTGTVSGTGFVVGSAVPNDAAHLLSDVTADRVVKFQLWGPDNATCSPTGAKAVFKQTVQAVQGPGTVHTTGGFTGKTPQDAQVVGVYQWTAEIVAPDGAVEDSSDCGSEPVVLVSGSDAISTTPSSTGHVGTVIHDVATVTGNAQSPLGTVIFTLFPPGNSTCNTDGTAAVLTSAAVSLTAVTQGVSRATGPDYTTLRAGTYHWVAAYSGDSTYPAARGRCGDEAVVITTAPPATPTPSIAPAGGVLAISTPGTGSGAAGLATSVGGFLILGGVGISLLALIPRNRRRTF